MPFVRKTDSQASQPPTDTRKLFIGRTGELLFFVQNILKPEEPTHNIISIWGQGGLYNSTLLAGLMNSFVNQNVVLKVQSGSFYVEKRHAPYTKWFGTSFSHLRSALDLARLLREAHEKTDPCEMAQCDM